MTDREQIAERLSEAWRESRIRDAYGRGDMLSMADLVLSLLSEARAEQERFVAGCRAALEEVGYTGSLDEAADKALERAREEARAEGERDMRERCAVECDERSALNDAVEGAVGIVRDLNGVKATAPGHRAIEARECAYALRALPLRSDEEEVQPKEG